MSFILCISHYREDTYLFTSGGDNTESNGVVIVYKYGKIQVSVSTTSCRWTAVIPPLEANTWYKFEISWSTAGGLEVYVNEALYASALTCIVRQDPVTVTTSEVTIGTIITTTTVTKEVNITVEELTTLNFNRTTLITMNVVRPRKCFFNVSCSFKLK